MKLNYRQLPVKAHFFFFMAAMGPILPFLSVYGKQLGISPLIMGSITAVLPILFLIAKPIFGYLVDYFHPWRKSIFVILLASTSACYICMYFLPALPGPSLPDDGKFKDVPCASARRCNTNNFTNSFAANQTAEDACMGNKRAKCHWTCKELAAGDVTKGMNFSTLISFEPSKGQANLLTNTTCVLDSSDATICLFDTKCDVECNDFENHECLYTSTTFWGFIFLMSLGTIGFNVCNCISDAICFDVLGEGGQMGYGRQRVWGTIGFGVTALSAGYFVDLWSQGQAIKIYTPAFILVLAFTTFDLICCTKLDIPRMTGSAEIVKDVYQLLKLKPIVIFLCFATLAGILDSFIIYFLFWYVEDLAEATGYMGKIKLIEGLIVAAETLGGEVIFFSLSGKILKMFGYGYTFTFCFVMYALRLGLISLAPTPWWVVPIELIMQGPTYALCYTTIVAYASTVSPTGTTATVQGIVAGMDDGLGFALGSLISGILYKNIGGVMTIRIFATIAIITSIIYLTLHELYLKAVTPDTRKNIQWKTPKDAQDTCVTAEM